MGLAVLVVLPIFGPGEAARERRAMAMVVAAPSELAIDASRELGALRANAGLPVIVQRLERAPHSLFDSAGGSLVGIDALGEIGAPEATPFLVRVLEGDLSVHWQDERAEIQQQIRELYRRSALKALGPIRDLRAEPFLIEALRSERDLFTMRYAALSLAQLRGPRGRKELTRFAMDPGHDPDRRLIAIQGLAWCSGDDWNRDDLLDLLEGLDDNWLQDRAVSTVAPVIPPDALPRFRDLARARPPGLMEASLVAAGDEDERSRAALAGGDVIQRAMLAMSFALPYIAGDERARMLGRFCALAPDRAVSNAAENVSIMRREIRLAGLVAELCTSPSRD